jgi:hypothetical protein
MRLGKGRRNGPPTFHRPFAPQMADPAPNP